MAPSRAVPVNKNVGFSFLVANLASEATSPLLPDRRPCLARAESEGNLPYYEEGRRGNGCTTDHVAYHQ
jgi:hypothetical protein